MSGARETPLEYNGWAKEAARSDAFARVAQSQDADNDTGEVDEFEDPTEMWIELVEACHLLDELKQRNAVNRVVFVAKNSHWTRGLWLAELELLEDSDAGMSFSQQPEQLKELLDHADAELELMADAKGIEEDNKSFA